MQAQQGDQRFRIENRAVEHHLICLFGCYQTQRGAWGLWAEVRCLGRGQIGRVEQRCVLGRIPRHIHNAQELLDITCLEAGLFLQLPACYIHGAIQMGRSVTAWNLQRPTMRGQTVLLDQRNPAIVGDGENTDRIPVLYVDEIAFEWFSCQ